MSIRAPCTTGRRARGASAWRTRPSPPVTRLWARAGAATPPAQWGCRLAKSSVSGSTWARFLPKSKSCLPGLQRHSSDQPQPPRDSSEAQASL